MALVTVIPGTFTTPGLPTLGIRGFRDTFTRPNATTLGGTEGMPRRPWTTWTTTGEFQAGIRDGDGYAANVGGAGHCVTTADALAADGTFEFTMGEYSAGQFGAVFRAASFGNYWRFLSVDGVLYRLHKFVGNTGTTIQSLSGLVPAPGDRIRIELDGPSITVYVNDAEAVQHDDTDHMDATRFGWYNNNTTANTVREVAMTA